MRTWCDVLKLAVVETTKGQTAIIEWLKKREKTKEKIQVGKKVIVSYGKTYHIAVVLSKEKDDGITDRWKVKYEDGGVEHVKAGDELSCFEDKTKKWQLKDRSWIQAEKLIMSDESDFIDRKRCVRVPFTGRNRNGCLNYTVEVAKELGDAMMKAVKMQSDDDVTHGQGQEKV